MKNVTTLHVQDFVTSMDPGWLVYESQNVIQREESTSSLRAPRTAIGVDQHGNLVLVVADGAEHWYVNEPAVAR